MPLEVIQGDDRQGAIAEITEKLAQANINITSVQAFCAGSGRYGGMLWVKAPDLRKAAKALGVSQSTVAATSYIVGEAAQSDRQREVFERSGSRALVIEKIEAVPLNK